MRVLIIVVASWLVFSIVAAFVLGAMVNVAKHRGVPDPAVHPTRSRASTRAPRPLRPSRPVRTVH